MSKFNNPENNNSDGSPDPDPDVKDFLRRHRITARLTNAMLRGLVQVTPLRTVKKYFVGMLEGSILGNPLLYPFESSMKYQGTTAGEWVAHDFRRREVMPLYKNRPLRNTWQGSLLSFVIDEVKDNHIEELTPTHIVNITNIDHIACLDKPSITELVDTEIVIPTTHSDAYKRVGAYEQYAEDLHSRNVADDLIYQVTPKGNGLVFIIPRRGDSQPKTEPQPELLPGQLPGLAT